MSWDHIKDSVGLSQDGVGPPSDAHAEMWAGPLELYQGSSAYQFARNISHFCAPGFALLMGTGMVLMALSRKQRCGWDSMYLLRFFCLRGTILVALGFVVRMSMWLPLIDPPQRLLDAYGPSKADALKHTFLGVFQVMTCLGLQMIVLAWIIVALHALNRVRRNLNLKWKWFPFGFQQSVFFVLGSVCFITTQVVIRHLQGSDPATAEVPLATSFGDVFVRFAVVPGYFADYYTVQGYPVIPWLAM